MKNDTLTSVTFDRRSIEEHLAQMEQERKARVAERREERKKGMVGASLREKLRACTPQQLRNAKKLCDQYIADHRKPPSKYECGKPYTVKVLVSVTIKNQRFWYEIRRSARTNPPIRLNGPYLHAYHRDGNIIKDKYIKDSDVKKAPRKVQSAIKPFRESKAEQLEAARKQYASRTARDI
jgi:vacuolar-type H+-ATPase subunit H